MMDRLHAAAPTILLIAVAYIAIVVFTGFAQRSLIYLPTRYEDAAPSAAARKFDARRARFFAADGTGLEAWWFPPPNDTAPVLLHFHGNAGDIRHREEEAVAWARRGLGFLLFDYRGYGASEGSPSEAGFFLDAEAAYSFLVDSALIAPGRIVLHSHSIGAGPAAHLTTVGRVGGLVFISPFTSLLDRAREAYPFLPVAMMLLDRYPVLDRVDSITIPVFIIHGRSDQIMGFHHSERLAAAFGSRADTWWIDGADHNDLLDVAGVEYFDRIESFARRVTAARDDAGAKIAEWNHETVLLSKLLASRFAGIDRVKSDLVIDGGNVVTSGRMAILTEKIFSENPNYARDEILRLLAVALGGMEIVTIPIEDGDPTGHADGMVRFLRDDLVVMNDYGKIDPALGNRIESILRARGLRVERIPYAPDLDSTGEIPPATGNYINFLRVGRLLVLPAYGHAKDEEARRIFAWLLPEAVIGMLPVNDLAAAGGVLNCVTATYRQR